MKTKEETLDKAIENSHAYCEITNDERDTILKAMDGFAKSNSILFTEWFWSIGFFELEEGIFYEPDFENGKQYTMKQLYNLFIKTKRA